MSYCCTGDFGDDGSGTDNSGFVPPDQSDVPASPLVLAPGMTVTPDPDEMYSKYYRLADLTQTSLPFPNLPLDQATQDNLRKLAQTLDVIRDRIGSFTIASVYRSPENQAALKHGAQGAASAKMAATHSYHSQGLAADITPTNNMTTKEFAQAIYQDELLKTMVGQIVDKAEGGQHSIHFSIQTRLFPKATPMKVASNGQYIRMTPTEIGSWLSSQALSPDDLSDVIPSEDQDDDDDEEENSGGLPSWAYIAGSAAALIGVLFAVKKFKKA
jgi:hypothetical protein